MMLQIDIAKKGGFSKKVSTAGQKGTYAITKSERKMEGTGNKASQYSLFTRQWT